MRRLGGLLLCLLALVSGGCGSGVGGGGASAPGAPGPSQLASEVHRAIQQAGSVRYSLEVTLESESSEPLRLTVHGDLARGEGVADVSFDGQGQSLAGRLLYHRGGFFIRYLGTWYGEQGALGDTDEVWREWTTEEGFGARLEDFFEGRVTEGPVADGVPTWAYNGRLNVDGLLDQVAQEAPLDGDAREQLEELARETRFTVLVGQADGLPRAFLLDLVGEGADLAGVAGPDPGEVRLTIRGTFSRWGEPVSVTPPRSHAPLRELFGQFLPF